MINAKKCDVCGKFYEEIKEQSEWTLQNRHKGVTMDLCDTCIINLNKFIDGGVVSKKSVKRVLTEKQRTAISVRMIKVNAVRKANKEQEIATELEKDGLWENDDNASGDVIDI